MTDHDHDHHHDHHGHGHHDDSEQGSEHDSGHGDSLACAIAHGAVPALTGDRRLVAVFDSPVARELAHIAGHLGYEVVVLEPDRSRVGPLPQVTDVASAGLDATTDVVVTDHDRPELGEVLAQVLRGAPRWIGVMGSPRHTGPHVAALRERGFDDEAIARVHRPIGLNIGSQSPAEIAVATLAGLLADRNGRDGGPYR